MDGGERLAVGIGDWLRVGGRGGLTGCVWEWVVTAAIDLQSGLAKADL